MMKANRRGAVDRWANLNQIRVRCQTETKGGKGKGAKGKRLHSTHREPLALHTTSSPRRLREASATALTRSWWLRLVVTPQVESRWMQQAPSGLQIPHVYCATP